MYFLQIILEKEEKVIEHIKTSLTHLCPVNSSSLTLDRSISYIRDVWLVFIITIFRRNF